MELVNSPEAFEEYGVCRYGYVYAESGYIGTDSWEWSYGMPGPDIGRRSDRFLLKTKYVGPVQQEKLPGEKAAENLRLFDENYITSDMKQEVKENE
ncbi:MAG: hypothetical protein ACLUOI_31065 [Eisenbergiella sp.]